MGAADQVSTAQQGPSVEAIAANADPLLGNLGMFDTATLLESNGGRGALPMRIRPVGLDVRVAGPAYPVRCPAGDNLWLHRAVSVAPKGSVLVACVDGFDEAGYWGEILTAAAMQRGLAGLVLDGAVRDARRLIERGFPVFCTGRCVRGTTKDPSGRGTLGAAIRIGETEIEIGDAVIGDDDGVVVIASGAVATVRLVAAQRVAREARIFERIAEGESTISIYGLARPVDSVNEKGYVRNV